MNRLFAISAGAGGATAALIIILALLFTQHGKVPIIPNIPIIPTPPANNNTTPTRPQPNETQITQPNPPSGPFYFDLSLKNQTTAHINYTIFTPSIISAPSSNSGSGSTGTPPVSNSHGSNVTTVIVHHGGGGGGPFFAIVKNALTANPDVIDVGGKTTFTQQFVTSPVTADTVIQIQVTMPNQDICGATGLPAATGPGGNLSKVFPDDFALIQGQKGDKCDTSQAGTYNAIGYIQYAGKVTQSTGAFHTRFFVVPETPVGSIALVVSSLGAVAAFVYLKRTRSESGSINAERSGRSVVGFCVRCKAAREMKNIRSITMKNGREATSGICSLCDCKMFRFGAADRKG